MPTFTHVFENFGDVGNVMHPKEDADRLNVMLSALQQKGAKILDIKVSVCHLPPIKVESNVSGTCRIYLILYEAQKPLL